MFSRLKRLIAEYRELLRPSDESPYDALVREQKEKARDRALDALTEDDPELTKHLY